MSAFRSVEYHLILGRSLKSSFCEHATSIHHLQHSHSSEMLLSKRDATLYASNRLSTSQRKTTTRRLSKRRKQKLKNRVSLHLFLQRYACLSHHDTCHHMPPSLQISLLGLRTMLSVIERIKSAENEVYKHLLSLSEASLLILLPINLYRSLSTDCFYALGMLCQGV